MASPLLPCRVRVVSTPPIAAQDAAVTAAVAGELLLLTLLFLRLLLSLLMLLLLLLLQWLCPLLLLSLLLSWLSSSLSWDILLGRRNCRLCSSPQHLSPFTRTTRDLCCFHQGQLRCWLRLWFRIPGQTQFCQMSDGTTTLAVWAARPSTTTKIFRPP